MTKKTEMRAALTRGPRGRRVVPQFNESAVQRGPAMLPPSAPQYETEQTAFGEMRICRAPLTPGMLRAH